MPAPTSPARPAHINAPRRREPSFPALAQTRGSSTLVPSLLSPSLSSTGGGAWGTLSPTAEVPHVLTHRKKGPSLSLGRAVSPDTADRPVAEIHPLKHTWEVWFSNRSGAKQGSKEDPKTGAGKEKESREEWETGVVKLGFFSSIESLHPFLAHLTPPSLLPASLSSTHALFDPSGSPPNASNLISDLNIFRSPVAPAWEDPANTGGGRWVLRLRKGVADRVWEEVVWALVGERLERDSDESGETPDGGKVCRVNGVVLSVRKDEDILSVWCTPSSRAEREFVRDSLRAALDPLLTPTSSANLILDYKPHPGSNHTLPTSSSLPMNTAAEPLHRHGSNDSRHSHTHHGHRSTTPNEIGSVPRDSTRESGRPTRNGNGNGIGTIGGNGSSYSRPTEGRGERESGGGDGARRERKEGGGITWGRA